MRNSELWVIQCKHTTNTYPPISAIEEVVRAAEFYEAKRMAIAVSRPPSDSFMKEITRYEEIGLKIEVLTPKRLLKIISNSPQYPKCRYTLKNFQQDAALKFRESLLDTGSAQLIMATGLGKTIVMAEVVADLLCDNLIKESKVLVVAHTKALIKQLHQNFWYQLPKWVHTHQLIAGETPHYWEGITFATIQSVFNRIEDLPNFGLLLIDEAHHIGADMFLETIRAINPPMIGGVTATPWRGDRFDIDQVLGSPVVRIGIAEGLQYGFLSEVDYRLLADNIDWDFIKEASRYNYSISQLNKKLIIPKRDDVAARQIRDVFDEEKRNTGIVFSPTIHHAKIFSASLRQYGFKAETISSELDDREQDKLMSHFRAGDFDLMVTVDMFNEGVDVPDVDLIVFLRTTHSRRIFVQQVGRGLRISPYKEKVIILDFVTDLRRIAEVLKLDAEVKGGQVERLGLGSKLLQFSDVSAGGFLSEWMLDQADLALREGDPTLEIPLNFPKPRQSGNIQ